MKYLVFAIIAFFAYDAVAQTTPTPMQKKTRTVYDPNTPREPVMASQARPIQNWASFKGATRCEQVGNQLTCDNGYKRTVR